MRILYLSLLLCVAQAFISSFLADTTTRDAENNAALEQREDVPPVEQQTGIATAPALTSGHLSRHEPTHHGSTAIHGNAGEDASHEAPRNAQEQTISRRDVKDWIALAKAGVDIKQYHDFLKSKVADGGWIYQIGPDDKILGYGNVTLTEEARLEVENHEDTFGMLEDLPIRSLRALPSDFSSSVMRERPEVVERREKLVPRDLKWMIQDTADEALVVDSQYEGMDISTHVDFVYPEHPSEDVFVYLIDLGIQIKVINKDEDREFKTDNDRVLQSSSSIAAGQSPETDDNVEKPSHGTRVASKAVGKKYGLAKEASLVSTKLYPKTGDWENGMWLILRDIKAHEGRASRSVVITSLAIGQGGITPEAAKNDERMQLLYGNDLRELSKLGVPFVMAAGNDAEKPNRGDVDQIPMVLQDDDIPLIIVGASDWEGKRAAFSQGGPLVTIYAPGVDIECQNKEDKIKATASGTSLAAPQVAGLIATYLSYSNKPWDDTKTGVERVKAIRDYVTSDKSSWERAPGSGIRVIWNGADEAAHGHDDDDDDDDESPNDSDPPPSSPPPPSKPSRKNKALSIIFQRYFDGVWTDNSWLFFKSDYGKSSVCRDEKQAMMKEEPVGDDYDMVNNPPWPGGTYEMNDLIDGVECDYLNDGTNPGSLWCQDWDATSPKDSEGPLPKDLEIKCKEEEMRWKREAENCSLGPLINMDHHAVVTCDW